jgi:cellulose synthase operon protein C
MKVNCPGCNASYKVDDGRIPSSGLKMRCPKCSTSFRVAREGAEGGEAETETGDGFRPSVMPKRPKPGARPAPPPKPSNSPQGPRASGVDPGKDEDPFGEIDLPSPKKDEDPFEDIDLPSPKKDEDPFGEIDLPSPKKDEDPFEDIDLPSPKKDEDPFGEIDLPSPAGASDLPSPAGASDLPSPAGASDLPEPMQGVSDVPSPAEAVDLPDAKDAADLPEPMQGVTDVPEPTGDVQDEVGDGPEPLGSSLDGSGPSPDDLGGPPQSADRDRVDASGSTDYGEIDLPTGDSERDDGGEFDAFPTESQGEEDADQDLGAPPRESLDLAEDAFDGTRRGSVLDEAPVAPERATGDAERKPGSQFEGRRRVERQKRRTKIALLIVLVVAALAGGALYFTPWGPFGAFAIARLLPSGASEQVVARVRDKVERRLVEDSLHGLEAAIDELEIARKNHPDDEDLRLLGVFLHNWHQIRFGDSQEHASEATRLLGAIEIDESDSPFARLASASNSLLGLKVPAVIEKLSKQRKPSTHELMLLGEAYLDSGEVKEALGVAEKLAAEEQSPRARFLKARALVLAGKDDEALPVLEKIVGKTPRHFDAALELIRLRLRDRDSDHELIAKRLKEIAGKSDQLTTPSQRARANALLGRMYFRQRHFAKAAAQADRAEELVPRDVVMLAVRGRLALLNDDLAQAANVFTRARSENPVDREALLGHAETMIRQGALNEAKDLLAGVLKKRENDARAHYLAGLAELRLKNKKKAEAELGRAVALDERLLDAYLALADLYMEQSREQEALRILDEARSSVQEKARISIALAGAHEQRGNLKQAAQELEAAIESEPENVQARFRLAQVLRKRKRYDRALEQLDEAAALNPNHPGLALEHGLLMELTGEVGKALKTYERALAENPDDVGTRIRVGAACYLLGRYDRAREMLEKAVEEAPESADANFYYGEVFRVTGNTAEAVGYLNQACELDDTNAVYHLRHGAALLDMRDMPGAMQEFERAKELEPEMPEVYLRIGEAKLRSGIARNAIEQLEKALELDPKLGKAYVLLGEAFEELANLGAALRCYERAVSELPDSAELHFKLGMVELQARGNNAASRSLAKATNLAKRLPEPPRWLPEAYYRLGTAQMAAGKRDSAVESFERYLEIAPEHALDRPEVLSRLEDLRAR